MWKKTITLLLALSAMLTLTACSGNSINSSGTQNNDERGQAFGDIPTLSEYLNGDEPVIAYGVLDIQSSAPVSSIRIFQNNTVTYIDTFFSGITLGDLSEMTETEIMALADQYFTIYDMPYLMCINTSPSDETKIKSESIWHFDATGEFGCNNMEELDFETGVINGITYYDNGIVVRGEPDKLPFRLDVIGTPGIEVGFNLWHETLRPKMDAIYTFPERNPG